MNYLNTKTVLIAFACLSLLSCKDQTQKTQQTITENTQENYISDKLVADPENEGEKMLLERFATQILKMIVYFLGCLKISRHIPQTPLH